MTPKNKTGERKTAAPKPPKNADHSRELRDAEYLEVVRESRVLRERGFKILETITL